MVTDVPPFVHTVATVCFAISCRRPSLRRCFSSICGRPRTICNGTVLARFLEPRRWTKTTRTTSKVIGITFLDSLMATTKPRRIVTISSIPSNTVSCSKAMGPMATSSCSLRTCSGGATIVVGGGHLVSIRGGTRVTTAPSCLWRRYGTRGGRRPRSAS